MDEIVEKIATAVIPGLIIAIVASIVTVRLSIRRFHEEKWWEKKEEAYSNLIELFHHFKDYTSKHIDDVIEPEKFTEEERKSWGKDWKEFNRKYAKARDLASFHLSDLAVSILDNYDKKRKEASKNEDVFQWMEDDYAAASECLEQLKMAAKNDLKVK